MNPLYENRLDSILADLPDRSIMFLWSGSPKQRSGDQDYPFTVNRNFYYLTGVDTAEYLLVITKLAGGAPKKTFFIPRPDKVTIIFNGHMPDTDEMTEKLGTPVQYMDRLDPTLESTFAKNRVEHIYMDFHQREISRGETFENALAERIGRMLPYVKFENIGHVIEERRRLKEPAEIAEMKEAIRITGLGIDSIMEHMAPGVNERELQAWFEFTLKVNGAFDNAFAPIVATGANSATLHYVANNCDLQDGDLLLLDLGAEHGYYNGDISRTFPANGKFTEEQRKLYEAVLAANYAVIERVKPGMHITETTRIAREVMLPYCQEMGLANDMKDMAALLPHGVSHYIGLDTHDAGEYDVLQPGMVISVEPGIYLPGKFGIRIEDDVMITEDGCEVLSPDIPKTVEEIETILAKYRN